jgi:hypothetical protein
VLAGTEQSVTLLVQTFLAAVELAGLLLWHRRQLCSTGISSRHLDDVDGVQVVGSSILTGCEV